MLTNRNWRAELTIPDPDSWSEVGPWHDAHPWSPWRLIGYDLWRWACEDPHCYCVYVQRDNSKRVAWKMLHSTYGEKWEP